MIERDIGELRRGYLVATSLEWDAQPVRDSTVSTYLSVYLSVCLSIYLSIYLSVCLSICLSVCTCIHVVCVCMLSDGSAGASCSWIPGFC